jgi:hypothetical protein
MNKLPGDSEESVFSSWDNVQSIEEYTENGSMAPMPYIRVTYTNGSVLEVCKHQLASVSYDPQ